MVVCWEQVLFSWRLSRSVLGVQNYYWLGAFRKRSDFQPASVIIGPFNQANSKKTSSPSKNAHKHTNYSPIPRLLPFLPWELNNEYARLYLAGWSEAANDGDIGGSWNLDRTPLWVLQIFSRCTWKSSLTSGWHRHRGCLDFSFLKIPVGVLWYKSRWEGSRPITSAFCCTDRRNQIHITSKLKP